MGLIISVYRSADMPDCTNDGVSSRFNALTLVNAPGPFEPTEDRPAAWLVKHPTVPGVVFIVCKDPAQHRGGMFGGNFGYTSDSRFSEAMRKMTGFEQFHGAAKIHDRYE